MWSVISASRIMHLMDFLQSGVEVKYNEEGREKTALVKLVNFDDAKLNDFKV